MNTVTKVLLRSITRTELDMLDFIVSFKQENDGNSPSVRDIRNAFDISSISVVDYHLKKLQRAGLIERVEKIARSIKVTDRGYETSRVKR